MLEAYFPIVAPPEGLNNDFMLLRARLRKFSLQNPECFSFFIMRDISIDAVIALCEIKCDPQGQEKGSTTTKTLRINPIYAL